MNVLKYRMLRRVGRLHMANMRRFYREGMIDRARLKAEQLELARDRAQFFPRNVV